MLNKLINNLIVESINDKYLFKAVFFAGGPGSGKSFILKSMFAGLPVVVCNSDLIFEKLLRKAALPLKIMTSNQETYEKQMQVRSIAKGLTTSRSLQWINGMLPLIIDGTGKDYEDISEKRNALEGVGYDTSMVFVNTSLEVALQRNEKRERSVPEENVRKHWVLVNNNLGKFQSLFGGGNFHIIDNSKEVSDKEMDDVLVKMTRLAMKIISSPLNNKVGSKIIDMLNQSGGLYVSDLEAHKEAVKKFKL